MKVKLVCQECGKIYSRTPYAAKSSHYCSNACRAKVTSRNLTNDLTGKRFGRWIVIQRSENGKDWETRWLCQCDCGTERIVYKSSLVGGASKSCGCWHKEVSHEQAKRLFTKHGFSKEPWYLKFLGHTRRERSKQHDKDWTMEMGRLLSQLQPCCVICGSIDRLAVDHVKPLSKGNPLRPGNAVVLCISHNSAKRTKDLSQLPIEWQAKIEIAAQQFLNAWNEHVE